MLRTERRHFLHTSTSQIKMRQAVLICCATLLVVVLHTNVVNAVCCPASGYPFAAGRCADGTPGTPYCAWGRCNIFGCDCKGGCRKGGRDVRISDDIVNTNTARGGSSMDTNGDGFVDREEAVRFLRMTGVQSPEAKVSSFDINGDGYLSNAEMDAVSVE